MIRWIDKICLSHFAVTTQLSEQEALVSQLRAQLEQARAEAKTKAAQLQESQMEHVKLAEIS